jgi:small conductance mechanosensitive channel
MRQTAAELRADPDFGPRILDELEISGVDQWAESAVMIKSRIKTVALEQWAVRREYLRRLKLAFDRNGLEIPSPQRLPAPKSAGEEARNRTNLAS